MLNGFVVIALFPFSRLVHLIMFPFWYLWRPYQLADQNTARPREGVTKTSEKVVVIREAQDHS